MAEEKKSSSIYYGWWIVATAAVGMSTGPGQFAFGSLGLFMIPLSEEFGWNRTEISLALTFFTVSLALSIPYIGRLVDRFGSRNVLLPSLAVFAVLLALIPLLVNQLWILFLLFVLIGSLAAGANALPYLRTISAWFDRRRGLAIGIAMGGSGMGFVYVPPMVQYMIDSYGWRSGYYMLAAVSIVIAIPLVYFVLREAPSQKEIENFDEMGRGTGTETSVPNIPMTTLLKRPLLWQLFSIFCLLSFSLYGVLSHLVPMLSDRGMSSGNAALVMSTLGISIVAARVIIGFIMDRFFCSVCCCDLFPGECNRSRPAGYRGSRFTGVSRRRIHWFQHGCGDGYAGIFDLTLLWRGKFRAGVRNIVYFVPDRHLCRADCLWPGI